jgi:hypothetical protein
MTTDLATTDLEIEKFNEVVASAPDILKKNTESRNKAIEYGQKIIDLAKTGMTDVYDAQLANFQVRLKKTVENMNDDRKPFTQIITAFSKKFTTLESDLKPIFDEVQEMRNAYATVKMNLKIETDKAAQLLLLKEKEIIEIRQLCDVEMGTFFSNCITKTRQDIAEYFNTLNLELIEEAEFILSTTSTNFDLRYTLPTNLSLSICMNFNTLEDYNKIVSEVLAINYQTKKYEYTREIQSTLKEYSDKLPSKKSELEAILKAELEEKQRKEAQLKAEQEEKKRLELLSKANAEEKAKLEAEQKAANIEKARLAEIQRLADEEKQRLADEVTKRLEHEATILQIQQLAREVKAQEDAAIAASASTAGAMIDAAVMTSETPNVKEGYSIQLKSTAGYLLLVQFWFEKEGKNLAIDKFEKMTFDRVKRFCEAYAIKNDEFLESSLLSYEPVYKAK